MPPAPARSTRLTARKRATVELVEPAPRPAPVKGGAAPLADAALPMEPSTEPAASSTQRIVEAIITAVVERRLMPGTKLAEQQIADLFGVSRTVVRQALNQLSRHHLVTLTPARGAFVAMPSAEEARQVFEVRAMLESSLVKQLCARITDAQVAELREHLRDERDAVSRTDVPGRTRLLADFHSVLARLAGNQVLAGLLADLLSRSSLIALMHQSAHSAEHSQAEHVQIVDALERRDARAAVRLMERHLEHVEHNLRLDPGRPDLAAALRPAGSRTFRIPE